MRNTFFSLCSKYQLASKAFERDRCEGNAAHQSRLPRPFSQQSSCRERQIWVMSWRRRKWCGWGKKVRMTCEDMLWLLPWLDSAGLIMDGPFCWRGLNTESQRRLSLLAVCIRALLCFITAGGYAGLVEFNLGFETGFMTCEVNSSFSWWFYGWPILLKVFISAKHTLWAPRSRC